MKTYYVYDLIDPRTQQPFYVGKGQGERLYEHVKRVQLGKPDINKAKCNCIREIIKAGYVVEHKYIQWFSTNREALLFERSRILDLGRICDNGILTNICKGDERPKKIERPINRCEYTTGEILETFGSTREAAIALNVKYPSSISNAVRGRIPSYMGFLWCYADESPILPKSLVYEWSQVGELIKIYKNEGDVCRTVGCKQGHLNKAINTNSTCYGKLYSRNKSFPKIRKVASKFPVYALGLSNKPVQCINTGVIYPTVTAAARDNGHGVGAVSACCLGKLPSIGGHMFKYVT